MTAQTLRACCEEAMDLQAIIDHRAKELVAPILREILELRAHGVPEAKITVLLNALRTCCALNDEMRARAQTLAGHLDELTRWRPDVSIKGLAAQLRPHLAVIADTRAHDGTAYVQAVCALREIIEATPIYRLAGTSMRHALSPSRHALLMGFVEGHAEPMLTRHVVGQEHPTTGCVGGGATSTTASPDLVGPAESFEGVAA